MPHPAKSRDRSRTLCVAGSDFTDYPNLPQQEIVVEVVVCCIAYYSDDPYYTSNSILSPQDSRLVNVLRTRKHSCSYRCFYRSKGSIRTIGHSSAQRAAKAWRFVNFQGC
jgi:hypothetical protein